MVDPRTPVLIGAGQLSRRVDRGDRPSSPSTSWPRRSGAPRTTAGAGPAALTGADAVHVVGLLSWRYRDPGRAGRPSASAPSPRRRRSPTAAATRPQSLVNRACLAIQAGDADLVLLAGAEAWRTRMAHAPQGAELDWTVQGDDVPSARPVDRRGADEPRRASRRRGVVMPVQVYPLFEQALRLGRGRTVDEHLVADLGALGAASARWPPTNPHAWIQRSVHRRGDPHAHGRQPHDRLPVHEADELEQRRRAGRRASSSAPPSGPRRSASRVDRWVFPHSGTDAHDHYFVSNRDRPRELARRCGSEGRRPSSWPGVGVDDLAHVDLYSCFPSAVEIAAAELGLGTDRPLTVTGGLSFAGGPWNNYVMHSIATMAGRPARRRRAASGS